MKDLTAEERMVLYDFVGHLNYYEIMGVLCKIYKEDELEEKKMILTKALCKLSEV